MPLKKRCKKLGIHLEKYYWQKELYKNIPESPREMIATNEHQIGQAPISGANFFNL